jgi:hypothetical protein
VFAVDSEKDGQEWFAGFMALCQVRVVHPGDYIAGHQLELGSEPSVFFFLLRP